MNIWAICIEPEDRFGQGGENQYEAILKEDTETGGFRIIGTMYFKLLTAQNKITKTEFTQPNINPNQETKIMKNKI